MVSGFNDESRSSNPLCGCSCRGWERSGRRSEGVHNGHSCLRNHDDVHHIDRHSPCHIRGRGRILCHLGEVLCVLVRLLVLLIKFDWECIYVSGVQNTFREWGFLLLVIAKVVEILALARRAFSIVMTRP